MPSQLLYDSGLIDLRAITTNPDDVAYWAVNFPASIVFPPSAYSSNILCYDWEFEFTAIADQSEKRLYKTRLNEPPELTLGRWTARAGNKVRQNGTLDFQQVLISGTSYNYTVLNAYGVQPFLYSSVIPPRFYARNPTDQKWCLDPLNTFRPNILSVPEGGLSLQIYDGEFGVGAIPPPISQQPTLEIDLPLNNEIDLISGVIYPQVFATGQVKVYYRNLGLPVTFGEPRQIGPETPPPGPNFLCVAAAATTKSIDQIIAEICACANPPEGCTPEQIAICAAIGEPCPCIQM